MAIKEKDGAKKRQSGVFALIVLAEVFSPQGLNLCMFWIVRTVKVQERFN
ncbi:hypothetical protein [Mesobacillus foraminis]|nr:hypothetical protein [Mesobacillus foraminis]